MPPLRAAARRERGLARLGALQGRHLRAGKKGGIMMETITLSREARLAGCALVRTRFAGRAALEREARRGSDVALAALEARLGLITEDERRERVLASALRVRRHTCAGYIAACPTCRAIRFALATPREREWLAKARVAAATREWRLNADLERAWLGPLAAVEIEELVCKRRQASKQTDPLATRKPRYAEREIIVRRVAELYADAQFRVAIHGHEAVFAAVEPGSEYANSTVDHVRPSEVGLPNSYAQHGYWVAQSTHEIGASARILYAEVRELNRHAPRGVLYLSENVRIVQGPGTALRVERRGSRGGWS
jgi:hypothetical protein